MHVVARRCAAKPRSDSLSRAEAKESNLGIYFKGNSINKYAGIATGCFCSIDPDLEGL
jgi:hypothetical protein